MANKSMAEIISELRAAGIKAERYGSIGETIRVSRVDPRAGKTLVVLVEAAQYVGVDAVRVDLDAKAGNARTGLAQRKAIQGARS